VRVQTATNSQIEGYAEKMMPLICRMSYHYAEAMLEARKKSEEAE